MPRLLIHSDSACSCSIRCSQVPGSLYLSPYVPLPYPSRSQVQTLPPLHERISDVRQPQEVLIGNTARTTSLLRTVMNNSLITIPLLLICRLAVLTIPCADYTGLGRDSAFPTIPENHVRTLTISLVVMTLKTISKASVAPPNQTIEKKESFASDTVPRNSIKGIAARTKFDSSAYHTFLSSPARSFAPARFPRTAVAIKAIAAPRPPY